MKNILNWLFVFLKKEASWCKGAFLEAEEEVQLLWRKQDIAELNSKLEDLNAMELNYGWYNPIEKSDVLAKLHAISESHNTILGRINAREARHEARHQQAVVQ